MLTIPIPLPADEKRAVEYYNDLKQCGADCVLIDVLEIFCDEPERKELFSRTEKMLKFLF